MPKNLVHSVHIDVFSDIYRHRVAINERGNPSQMTIPKSVPFIIRFKSKTFKISAAHIKYKLFDNDDYTCRYCGLRATAVDIFRNPPGNNLPGMHFVRFKGRQNRFLTIDHVHPRSKGGPNNFENLQTLCNVCNNARGANEIPGCFYLQSPKCENGYSEKILVTTDGNVFDASVFEINSSYVFCVTQPKITIPVSHEMFEHYRKKVIDIPALKKSRRQLKESIRASKK